MTATTTTAAAPPPASTSLSARRQRKLQKQLQEQQKQKQQQGEQSSSATFAPAGITVNGVPPKPKLILEPPASAFSHLRLHRDTDRSLKKHPIPAHRGVADAYRAHYVREMLQHAWKGYATFALDADDLQPLSATPHNWYAGGGTLLNTAVDALSTLFVANLTAEYEVAKEAVLMHYLRPSTLRRHVNVFETTIRVLGGLLGAYELDGDALLLEAARGVADRLLPALDAGEGGALPLNYVNLADGTARDQYGGKTWIVLSQAGSLQLEFQYLSDVTGDPVYAEKALAVLRNLAAKPGSNIPGLVPSHFTAAAQSPFHKVQAYGVGPNSDSYYEYLLKLYVATGDARFMDMFAKAADAMVMYMLQESPDGVFTYLPDINSQQPGVATPNQMFHHLSCFTGGMFALSSLTTCPHRAHPAHLPAPHTCASQELLIARKLTSTCVATATLPDTAGVGFELAGIELQKGGPVLYDRGYSLRPEIVESVFYLWRITGDVVWREVGWKLAQKLNTRCRNAVGFHVLNDVYDPASAFDRQESFFLAETLKYLYLLFSDDSLIPLDRYVFNTEAHPLSIRGHGRRKDVKWGTKTPM
ncbi:glycoside hydrolase [Zopfochytrium polystomum]|nr:glycoside hydrolase [Zopfochytrium polystomum]